MSSTPVVTGRRTQELCVNVDFDDFQACLFEEYEDFVDYFELYRDEGICSALEFSIDAGVKCLKKLCKDDEVFAELECEKVVDDVAALSGFGFETLEELDEELGCGFKNFCSNNTGVVVGVVVALIAVAAILGIAFFLSRKK